MPDDLDLHLLDGQIVREAGAVSENRVQLLRHLVRARLLYQFLHLTQAFAGKYLSGLISRLFGSRFGLLHCWYVAGGRIQQAHELASPGVRSGSIT